MLLSMQLMIGIVIDFQLPSEKFLEIEFKKSEKSGKKSLINKKS